MRNVSLLLSASGLQVLQQPLKVGLIGVVLFPSGKVSNEPASLKEISPASSCAHNCIVNPNGKENLSVHVHLVLFFACSFDFLFYPLTFDRMLRENQQQLVIHSDRLINSVVMEVSWFQFLWCIPATYTIAL